MRALSMWPEGSQGDLETKMAGSVQVVWSRHYQNQEILGLVRSREFGKRVAEDGVADTPATRRRLGGWPTSDQRQARLGSAEMLGRRAGERVQRLVAEYLREAGCPACLLDQGAAVIMERYVAQVCVERAGGRLGGIRSGYARRHPVCVQPMPGLEDGVPERPGRGARDKRRPQP